jgi:hypothetical protein
MRVLLRGGTPFKSGLLKAEGFDLVGREDLLGGEWGGTVAGVDELHDAAGDKEGKFNCNVGNFGLMYGWTGRICGTSSHRRSRCRRRSSSASPSSKAVRACRIV